MIKKWEDRRDIHDYHAGPIRNTVIHELMQAEIDELRAALQERDAEIERLAGSELGLNRYLATAQTELASIKQQEPVMQHCPNCNHEQMALSVDCGNCGNVYDAAPVQAQERKPLTDDQITEVWRELREQKGDWSDLDFARAIEAKIKEQAAPVQAQTAPNQEPVALSRIKPFVSGLGKAILDELMGDAAGAQERKPLFGDFLAWAIDNGYDTANTCNSNTGKWICLNPMTGDLWKAWQAAHGIKEQP